MDFEVRTGEVSPTLRAGDQGTYVTVNGDMLHIKCNVKRRDLTYL